MFNVEKIDQQIKDAAKLQLHEMFLGRVEEDVVDMVLAGCNYKVDDAIDHLLLMATESEKEETNIDNPEANPFTEENLTPVVTSVSNLDTFEKVQADGLALKSTKAPSFSKSQSDSNLINHCNAPIFQPRSSQCQSGVNVSSDSSAHEGGQTYQHFDPFQFQTTETSHFQAFGQSGNGGWQCQYTSTQNSNTANVPVSNYNKSDWGYGYQPPIASNPPVSFSGTQPSFSYPMSADYPYPPTWNYLNFSHLRPPLFVNPIQAHQSTWRNPIETHPSEGPQQRPSQEQQKTTLPISTVNHPSQPEAPKPPRLVNPIQTQQSTWRNHIEPYASEGPRVNIRELPSPGQQQRPREEQQKTTLPISTVNHPLQPEAPKPSRLVNPIQEHQSTWRNHIEPYPSEGPRENIRELPPPWQQQRPRQEQRKTTLPISTVNHPLEPEAPGSVDIQSQRYLADNQDGKEYIMIIMRGLPGSGKSTLAWELAGRNRKVFSTDDFFEKNGKYEFNANTLPEAHEWNKREADRAMEDGVSPVIIDNTNKQRWEMKPYVAMALKHGYAVDFQEPTTPWAWNPKELARRNHHNVTKEHIEKLIVRYEKNVTVETVMNAKNVRSRADNPKSSDCLRSDNITNGYNERSTDNRNVRATVPVLENKHKRQRCDPQGTEFTQRRNAYSYIKEHRNHDSYIKERRNHDSRTKFGSSHGRTSPNINDNWRRQDNGVHSTSRKINNEIPFLRDRNHRTEKPKAQRTTESGIQFGAEELEALGDGREIDSDSDYEWKEIEEALDRNDATPKPQRQVRHEKPSNTYGISSLDLIDFDNDVDVDNINVQRSCDSEQVSTSPDYTKIEATVHSFDSNGRVILDKTDSIFVSRICQSNFEDSLSDSDIEVVSDDSAVVDGDKNLNDANDRKKLLKYGNLEEAVPKIDINTQQDTKINSKPVKQTSVMNDYKDNTWNDRFPLTGNSLIKTEVVYNSDSGEDCEVVFEARPANHNNSYVRSFPLENVSNKSAVLSEAILAETKGNPRRLSNTEYVISDDECNGLDDLTTQKDIVVIDDSDKADIDKPYYTIKGDKLTHSTVSVHETKNTFTMSKANSQKAITASTNLMFPHTSTSNYHQMKSEESGIVNGEEESSLQSSFVSNIRTSDENLGRESKMYQSNPVLKYLSRPSDSHAVIEINDEEVSNADRDAEICGIYPCTIETNENIDQNSNTGNCREEDQLIQAEDAQLMQDEDECSDFEFLLECFPDYDAAYLRTLLAITDGDVLATCTELLKDTELNDLAENLTAPIDKDIQTTTNDSLNKIHPRKEGSTIDLPERSEDSSTTENEHLEREIQTESGKERMGRNVIERNGASPNVTNKTCESDLSIPKNNKNSMPGPRDPDDYLDWLNKEYDEPSGLSESNSILKSKSVIEENIPALNARHDSQVTLTPYISTLDYINDASEPTASCSNHKEDVPVLISSVQHMDIACAKPTTSKQSKINDRFHPEFHDSELFDWKHFQPRKAYKLFEHSLKPRCRSPSGELFFCEDSKEGRDTDSFKISLDRRLAIELEHHFGENDEIDVGALDRDDFILNIDKDFANTLYNNWKDAITSRKRSRQELVESDELFAKQLQQEEHHFEGGEKKLENTQTPDHKKRKRTEPKLTWQFNSEEKAWKCPTEAYIQPEDLPDLENANTNGDANFPKEHEANRLQLHNMFIGCETDALDQIFSAMDYDLHTTANLVMASCGLLLNQHPKNVFADNFRRPLPSGGWQQVTSPKMQHVPQMQYAAKIQHAIATNSQIIPNPQPYLSIYQTFHNPQYQDYRAEAQLHARQRKECLEKAAKAHSARNSHEAQFYTARGNLHAERMNGAHERAAQLIFQCQNADLGQDDTIDLHGLHPNEAIEVLAEVIIQARKGNRKFINIITGRGLHSTGKKAKIKPAVENYLRQHSYRFTFLNEGNLQVYLE